MKKLDALEPANEIERVAKSVMKERLESEYSLLESYERQGSCAVISSPIIEIRQVFELTPGETPEQIATLTKRFRAVDAAHKSWTSSLDDLYRVGKTAARRQIAGIADQLDSFAKGAYSGLAARFDADKKYPELHAAAKSADESAA
ncbi:MAG: DUF885 family protein [Actinomycetota bacterium]